MTSALVIIALLVTAGGVVAVSAREPRLAALGVVIALVGAAFVADPLPDVAAVAARVVGSVLAGYLVWVSLRGAPPPTTGWRIGWPGAAAVATVAFVTGWLASGTIANTLAVGEGDGPSVGAAAALAAGSLVPRAALGASLALVTLAAAPVLVGRDVLRLGLGLLLVLGAVELLRNALGGRPDPIVELALGVLTAVSGAAVAWLVARSLAIHGDLMIRTPGRDAPSRATAPGRRATDEAHPRHLGPGPGTRVPRDHGPGAHPLPGHDRSGWGGVS